MSVLPKVTYPVLGFPLSGIIIYNKHAVSCYCHTDIQQLYQENQRLIVILTTSCAAGSILTCSLISVCTLCMCIVKVYKKRFKLPEEVLEIQRIEPVYETIEPAYAVIVDHEQICETNFNNAYNV